MNAKIEIDAPQIISGARSEAEILGSVVWLWMHCPFYRDIPLSALTTTLLPIIKNKQYALFSLQAKPIGFLSWAWFDESAETHYIEHEGSFIPQAHWFCGDRLWINQIVAPFGHVREVTQLITTLLFPEQSVRMLYHHSKTKGLRIKRFYGRSVSKIAATKWDCAHPLSAKAQEIVQRRQKEKEKEK